MTRELVLVHGRAQEHKDSIQLKKDWLDALAEGLAKSNLTLPIAETAVHFPYYGDTLIDLVDGKSVDQAAQVIVRGAESDADEKRFVRAVLEEIRLKGGITDAELAEIGGQDVVDKGPLNWEWVQTIMKALDRHAPGGSATSIALFTHDVYEYLTNSGIRQTIEDGISNAIAPGVETVVVSHSLGTVVAYNLLRREGKLRNWQVPLLVTVGSPLAVDEIRKSLRGFAPTRCPECATSWFNAFDTRDVVALYPLDPGNFPLDPDMPSVENYPDVHNKTDNRHGIAGYLDDQEVAKRIYNALTADEVSHGDRLDG
jgi:hypothetical protein